MTVAVKLTPVPRVNVDFRPTPPDKLPPVPTWDDQPKHSLGHYQSVLLDTRTGTLSYHCADWRIVVGPDQSDAYAVQYPGAMAGRMYPHDAMKPVPDLLRWRIETWLVEPDDPTAVSPRPYLSNEDGNTFVKSLAPLAQRLLDSLVQVDGTDDRDYSAAALVAENDIERACSRYQRPPVETNHRHVDFADVVAVLPNLINPAWAAMSNHQLDDATDWLARRLFHGPDRDRLAEHFPGQQLPNSDRTVLEVTGIRAWLYAYRAAAADDLAVTDASDWYTTHPSPVTANTTDADLAAAAEAEAVAAAAAGVKLVGIPEALRVQRRELRDRIWAELESAGRLVESAEDTLKRARATRAGLLAQVIGWGDGRADNGAELGRQAHMSRQAIDKFRAQLDGEDDD